MREQLPLAEFSQFTGQNFNQAPTGTARRGAALNKVRCDDAFNRTLATMGILIKFFR